VHHGLCQSLFVRPGNVNVIIPGFIQSDAWGKRLPNNEAQREMAKQIFMFVR
jgi:hypothetical protein